MIAAAETISTVAAHMGISFGVMYAITGSASFGGVAAVVEPIAAVVLMPLHEKMWEKIRSNVEKKESQSLVPVGA